MKILILSDACFNDNIFPMYKAMLAKGLDVTCLINLTSLKVMLFDINKRLPQQKIIKATEYPELRKYQQYVDMSNIYLVNHQIDKKHFWRELTSTVAIWKFIKSGRFDVIHTDFVFQRTKIFLYVFRKKIVFVRHDPLAHTGMSFSKSYDRALKVAYNLIDRIVILNRSQYESFCSFYNIDPKRVFINRLGPLECIKMFGHEGEKEIVNNVLFFGRIVEYKGVEYLCKAMKIVHDTIPSATLTIAGSGSFNFDINKYKELSYVSIVNRYIGVDELADMIRQSTITVCYYTDATQSGGVLTSYTFNKPVVASDIPAMREIVDDGKSGVLVSPKDEEKLAVAIINTLSNRQKLDEMGRFIENEYTKGIRSWYSIIDRYLEIYKGIK